MRGIVCVWHSLCLSPFTVTPLSAYFLRLAVALFRTLTSVDVHRSDIYIYIYVYLYYSLLARSCSISLFLPMALFSIINIYAIKYMYTTYFLGLLSFNDVGVLAHVRWMTIVKRRHRDCDAIMFDVFPAACR